MDKTTAQRLVRETFRAAFDKRRFRDFVNELCNGFNEDKAQSMQVPDAFAPHVRSCQRLGTFESGGGELADVLVVNLTETYKLERTRTALRDFVAHKLKRDNSYKEAGLVAFVAPDSGSWRFSFVQMEYETRRDPITGKIKPEARLTPARRYSYLVGTEEECHTAQTRFLHLLQNTTDRPSLAQIEEAFSVESVTEEFFREYARLFETTQHALDAVVKRDKEIRDDFRAKNVNTVDFTKKLLGQIVFLYFIQKKGWLGVPKGGKWGEGPLSFLRRLADGALGDKKSLFNDVLEPLFYDTLASDRGRDAWCKNFQCRIPFLNGGLFEPLAGYNWEQTAIDLPNAIFTNQSRTQEGDLGSGILDVFDRYNFTVNESEPLEKEVAIDPEMLGKVFENLIEDNRRKGLGAYYTPREITHYMCQETIIDYLANRMASVAASNAETLQAVLREDLASWIRQSDQFAHYAAAIASGTKGEHYPKVPDTILKFADVIDALLRDITVCDPAIGSGAFPVGMMTEIVRARVALTPYFKDATERTPYHFKRHAIQSCLYGADIDAGAVEIAKLRLWLSLVVDEEDVKEIRPLPNLDYKVVVGNSLLGVGKNLFNNAEFRQLEALKPHYFDESNRATKLAYKKQIDDLIHELTNGHRLFDFEIYFSEVFHKGRGFDVVIANPPYLKERDNKDAFDIVTSTAWGKKYHEGKMDYWYFFLHRGLELANVGGIVSFISSRYWLNSAGSKKLIEHIRKHAALFHVVDIGKLPVFEQVAGHHMLHFYRGGTAQTQCLVKSLEGSLQDIAASAPTAHLRISTQSPESLFTSGGEIRLYEASLRLRSTLTVGDRYEVTQGVVQNPDKVSAVMAKRYGLPQGNGVFVLSSEEFASLRLSAEELLYDRPFYDESAVRRFHLERGESKHLLYVTKHNCHSLRGLPNLARHLSKYREIMDARRETLNGSIDWFQLHWPRDPRYFEAPKVVLPSMFRLPNAAYVAEPAYFGLGSNVVIGGDKSYSLVLLCALLNSKVGAWWFNTNGKQRGVGVDVGVERLRQFPLPQSSEEFAEIERLTNRIISAKGAKARADTAKLEVSLDTLVNRLYGLSDGDIQGLKTTHDSLSDA